MRYILLRLFLKPKYSLKVADGKVIQTHGKLPPAFKADIEDIAGFSGCSSGLIYVIERESGIELKVYGSLKRARQQILNILHH